MLLTNILASRCSSKSQETPMEHLAHTVEIKKAVKSIKSVRANLIQMCVFNFSRYLHVPISKNIKTGNCLSSQVCAGGMSFLKAKKPRSKMTSKKYKYINSKTDNYFQILFKIFIKTRIYTLSTQGKEINKIMSKLKFMQTLLLILQIEIKSS